MKFRYKLHILPAFEQVSYVGMRALLSSYTYIIIQQNTIHPILNYFYAPEILYRPQLERHN